MTLLRQLADCMVLSTLLEGLRLEFGAYELIDHWQQGEFHHDIVLRLPEGDALPGPILVIATNCNGGIKEVLCFAQVPQRYGLWRLRCPESEEFQGEVPRVLGRETTFHWFNPCELLTRDARSELRAQHRQRQLGGGWQKKG